jgi:hypothetical protein
MARRKHQLGGAATHVSESVITARDLHPLELALARVAKKTAQVN